MKRTPLLTPALDGSKNHRITYVRTFPPQDGGKLGDVVVDLINVNRYIKTPSVWQSVNSGLMRDSIDDEILRDARIVGSGKFKERAIKRACEQILETMRATRAISCHYENGDLCNGWAR